MKKQLKRLCQLAAPVMCSAASAHTGHGVPGTFSHDFQHQLWLFGALVVVSALLVFQQSRQRDRD